MIHNIKIIISFLALILISLVIATGKNLFAQDPAAQAFKFEKILVTDGDITDKKYEKLGEIKVNIQPDESTEEGIKKLKRFAYLIGADAIIFIKITRSNNDFSTRNTITISGIAVKFK